MRHSFWSWTIALTLGLGLLVLAFSLDRPFQEWQHRHVWKNITILRRNITRATDWPSHIIIGLSAAGIAWWRGSQKWRRIFLAMVVAGALAGMGAYALKVTTGRTRPSVRAEKVFSGPSLRQNFQSFPSGHTAVSTGFFGILFFASWRLGLLALPVPMFVAFSRFFLGAHYLPM